MRVALCALLAGVLVGCSPRQSGGPSPALTPVDVVSIQVNALRDYNRPSPNAGIWTVYQFASPANRQTTGPYGRFLRIIKSPANSSLLHAREWRIAEVRQAGSLADVVVEVTDDVGVHQWIFSLTKQEDGPFKDCWMTDGVVS